MVVGGLHGEFIGKIGDMLRPGPSDTFVLLEEREDSINDGFFIVLMDKTIPTPPAQ